MKTHRAVSFDESSMESINKARKKTSIKTFVDSYDPNQNDVTSLEEAKNVIAELRARQKSQAHQMIQWKRALKYKEDLLAKLNREKNEQLRNLSCQLLLFESRLRKKQKEIESNLAQREAIILRQQRVIKQLQNKLRMTVEATNTQNKNNLLVPTKNSMRDSPTSEITDAFDSLGDSDSAVVLEEGFHDDPTPPRFRSNVTDITVIRSVSDAVEPSSKYSSTRRCNGFLRRPEVLETVYSVEEDTADADKPENEVQNCQGVIDNSSNSIEQKNQEQEELKSTIENPRLRELYGSYERLVQPDGHSIEDTPDYQRQQQSTANQRPREENRAQVTYNRVMSNHRSVTKPKDVKYKRINKAKSKSLEELRGKLRNWVEKGTKIAIPVDQ